MAFLVKNSPTVRTAGSSGVGQAYLSQFIHVASPARVFPQTTTDQIFRVRGGRVMVHLLIGELTVPTTTDPQLTLIAARLSNANVVVGTAVNIAATAALTSKEIGASIIALGSAAAFVISNAGVINATLGRIPFILPQGEIYMSTAASQAGQIKFDIWYQPLDEGAYVEAVVTPTVAI